ncbi:hypothetical protein MASR2M50_07430 [Thauera sp.]
MTPSLTSAQSWPATRFLRDSQPSIHLPLVSNLPGTNWAGSGLSMRLTSAKKSSEAVSAFAPRRGLARSTERSAQSGSSAAGAKTGAPGVWLAMGVLLLGGYFGL